MMICSDPMIKFFCGSVSSLVTDLADTLTKQKKTSDPDFFLWIRPVGSIILMLLPFRICDFV
jgi:hypothetical protein